MTSASRHQSFRSIFFNVLFNEVYDLDGIREAEILVHYLLPRSYTRA